MIKYAVAAALLATFAGLACAEGSHDFSGLEVLFKYLAGVMLVMLLQGLYMLCLPRTTWSMKFMWVFALAIVDVMASLFVLSSYVFKAIDLENPIGFVLMVIPGFFFIYWVQSRSIHTPPSDA